MSMPLIARILILLVALPVLLFCVLGFFATFEPPESLAWRTGYGIVALVCLAAAVWALFAPRPRG